MVRPSPALRTALLIVSFVAMIAATLLIYAQDRLLDADDFGDVVVATLDDPGVNEFIATTVVNELVRQVPDTAIATPLLRDIASSLLDSGAAQAVVERAAVLAHETAFSGDETTLLLELSDMVVLIERQLVQLAPDLAAELPDQLATISSVAVEMSSGEAFSDLVGLARTVRRLTWLSAAVAMASLVALAVREPNPWRGIETMGVLLAVVGITIVIAETIGGGVVTDHARSDLEASAVEGVWNAVLGGLRRWGWTLAGTGAFLAGSAWAIDTVGGIVEAGRDLGRRIVRAPDQRSGWAWRGLGLGGAAVWAIGSPDSFLSAALRVVGLIAAMAATAMLSHALGIDRVAARLAARADERAGATGAIGALRHGAVPIGIVAVLAGVGAWMLGPSAPAVIAVDTTRCNGAVELCDRRLDQVAMAASHNAMASTDLDFYLPNQTNTITQQLDDGIRGLMLDTWYGRPSPDGVIITTRPEVDIAGLSPTKAAAVRAAIDRAGADLGAQSVYMCHSFCETGSVLAVDVLTEVRRWMVANPRDVVVIIVQDATEPGDTAEAFIDAGLEPFALRQTFGEPLPTLGEMIESGQRLFVMVEEDPGEIDWLHDAFTFSQETHYSFGSVDDFTCTENRGRPDSPLFVINHFLTPAFASNHVINNRDVALARASACQAERGMIPNLIAGDFVERGDLVAVADELNGLGG